MSAEIEGEEGQSGEPGAEAGGGGVSGIAAEGDAKAEVGEFGGGGGRGSVGEAEEVAGARIFEVSEFVRVVVGGEATDDGVGHGFGGPDLIVGSGDKKDGRGGVFDGNFGGEGWVFLAEGVAVKIDEADGPAEGDDSDGGENAEAGHGVWDERKMRAAVSPGGAGVVGIAGFFL